MENNLVVWSGNLLTKDLDIKEVIIINEFTSQKVELKYFKIDTGSGKLTFNTPFGYFHEFMQKTTMNSMEDQCMKNAQYDVHVLFMVGEQKGTLIFSRPYMLSCNNYGTEEGHQILLQATERELKVKKGWIYGRSDKECPIQQPVDDPDRRLQHRDQKELGYRTM